MRVMITCLLALFFSSTSLFAQVLNPVKWEMSQKQISAQEFDLIFTANIDQGWTIYSQHTDEGGPVPTSFEFDAGTHFTRVGEVKELGKTKEGNDPLFGVNVIKFKEQKVRFIQRVKATDLSKSITGYLTFMTCDNARCLPPKDIDFDFKLKANKTKNTDTGNASNKDKDKAAALAKAEAMKKAAAEKQAAAAKEKLAQSEKIKAKKAEDRALITKAEAEKEAIAKKLELNAAGGAAQGSAGANAKEEQGESGILDPVSWTFKKEKISDTEYDLIFTATAETGWTIYSQHTEEGGPVATSFLLDAGTHFEAVGETEEKSKKKEGPDPLFDGVNVIKFVENPVTFRQRIKWTDTNKAITGAVEFMTCDSKQCLPPKFIDFSFDLNKGIVGNKATGNSAKNQQGNVIDQVRPSLVSTNKEPIGDCGGNEESSSNLLWIFFGGFIGGLLALLTPCVFPMIPLTVSFFTKGSKDKKQGIKNGLIYGLSIIVIYVAIGLLVTAVFGPKALNELSTNAIANVLFFLIFVAFAFSFFGYYEITLPSSIANKSDSMADRGGLIGTFFMAFTLAIVSFSCTGPIIGTALVQSAVNPLGPFMVMFGFSTALALPFGLFAAFPAWLNSLPRSGSWMTSVKVVLGFLELALALKFLSVADMTMHWGILKYELFMGLWILIFAGMTLYLFGYIKFPHDSPLKKLSMPRLASAIGALAFTIYLCTGFMFNERSQSYNALGALSGLAPPAYYNYFIGETDITKPNPTIKAKYPSFTKCANNLDCFKDYYEGLAYAQEVNKPVFLDFTGYGCVNCRKTEEHIWSVDNVWKKLDEDFVLVSLYVDDRKKLKETLISKPTQEKLRNIGNMWADFQIVNFKQNSQPLYVIMSPDEKVLARPRGYKEGAEDYADFMDCGLKTYESYAQQQGMK
ncbi:MAG: protein-disulfide reductase DsbD family protein [Saprospiraceae bacterium]